MYYITISIYNEPLSEYIHLFVKISTATSTDIYETPPHCLKQPLPLGGTIYRVMRAGSVMLSAIIHIVDASSAL